MRFSKFNQHGLARQVESQFRLRNQIHEVENELARRQRIEEKLRYSEERFRSFMDHSPAMAFMKDEAGRFVYVNEPVCKRFDKPETEWLGRTDHELWAPEVADALRATDRRILESGKTEVLYETVPTPDGETYLWQSFKFPFTDPSGHKYLAGMAVDRTAEKRAEDALKQSEQLFRNVVEQLAEGVVLLDRTSRKILRSNRAFLDLLGYSESELGERTQYDFVAHDADDIDEKMARIEERGRLSLGYRKYRRKDGSIFDVTVSGSYLVLDGRACLCLVVQDMTELKKTEDALRESEAMFRNTVDRLAEGVFVVDPTTGKYLDANSTALAMLGYKRDEFLELSPLDVVAREAPEVLAGNVERMKETLTRDGRCDLGMKHLFRKDGTIVPVDIRVSHVPNRGAGLHAVIIRDMTERLEYESRLIEYQSELERKNAKLQKLATTDALTGLYNRMAMNEKLDSEFQRAVRYDHSFSFILLDVDHFKTFNDAFGHPAGDEVLKTVAELIRKSVREVDFAARYGGEEFAVLLPDTDRFGAIAAAERCRAAIAGHDWKKRSITISIGISSLTPTTGSEDEMIREADQALYRSKHAGRNRVNHGSNIVGIQATLRV